MRIYKYLPPERIDVLANLKIRFTQPEALNDPFESKPYFREAISEETFDKIFYEQARKAYEDTYSKHQMSWEKFLRSSGSSRRKLRGASERFFIEKMKEFEKKVRSELGFLSLSESFDNLLMWSHYTDSHRGFVLEFDTSDKFFELQRNGGPKGNLEFGKVFYSKDRPSINVEELRKEKVLFTKPECWKYEEEWRLIRSLSPSEIRDINDCSVDLVDIPKTAIAAVYIGANCSNDSKQAILDEVKRQRLFDVVQYEMRFCEKEFKVRRFEIK